MLWPCFFLFLFLLVKILLIVENLADRGICLGRNFNEIKFKLFGNGASLLNGIDAWSHIISYETHFACTDVLVYIVGVFGVTVG